MKQLLKVVLLMSLASSASSQYAQSHNNTFNVLNFGAVGNPQKNEDTQAFAKTWQAACAANSSIVVVVVPQSKTFLIKSVRFDGPCKPSALHFQLEGNLVAPSTEWSNGSTDWITFLNVKGLALEGTGKIDGQGQPWWKRCPTLNSTCMRPTALVFDGCRNFSVNGITSVNSPRNHITVLRSQHGSLSNLWIQTPATSPNTDGINVGFSSYIQILYTYIASGDDCIALESGCLHINVSRVTCGPGHGIRHMSVNSVGSLGLNGDQKANSEAILVRDSTIRSAMNGVRIKTWQGSGGHARGITFQNITVEETYNPIIIDQFYCPHSPCDNKSSNVKISNVKYDRVHGTSLSKNAINLGCSQSVGCTGLILQHINITAASSAAATALNSICTNAHGNAFDTKPLVSCLLP